MREGHVTSYNPDILDDYRICSERILTRHVVTFNDDLSCRTFAHLGNWIEHVYMEGYHDNKHEYQKVLSTATWPMTISRYKENSHYCIDEPKEHFYFSICF